MCGCWSEAASWISRRKRSMFTAADISGGSTLMTTWRPSAVSRARNTCDMPPPPSSRSMRKASPSDACKRSWSSDMRVKLWPEMQSVHVHQHCGQCASDLRTYMRLDAPAETRAEKLLGRARDSERGLALGKSMSLVGSQEIRDGNVPSIERHRDLIGLSLGHAWIIGSLKDQERCASGVGAKERRAREHVCPGVRVARVTNERIPGSRKEWVP